MLLSKYSKVRDCNSPRATAASQLFSSEKIPTTWISSKSSPTMGIAPLHMVQLMATWAGVFPPCAEPMSFIKLISGEIFSSLSSLKMASLGPPGFLPFFVYLPAATQRCQVRHIVYTSGKGLSSKAQLGEQHHTCSQ